MLAGQIKDTTDFNCYLCNNRIGIFQCEQYSSSLNGHSYSVCHKCMLKLVRVACDSKQYDKIHELKIKPQDSDVF